MRVAATAVKEKASVLLSTRGGAKRSALASMPINGAKASAATASCAGSITIASAPSHTPSDVESAIPADTTPDTSFDKSRLDTSFDKSRRRRSSLTGVSTVLKASRWKKRATEDNGVGGFCKRICSAIANCFFDSFIIVSELWAAGVLQLMGVLLFPLYRFIVWLINYLTYSKTLCSFEHRLVQDISLACDGNAPPAPPAMPGIVTAARVWTTEFASSHPIFFLCADFCTAFAIGIFFLFLKDISEYFEQMRLRLNKRRRRSNAVGYKELKDEEVGAPNAAALSEELGAITDEAEQLEIRTRVHRKSISANAVQQREMLKKLLVRQEELQSLVTPVSSAAVSAQPEKLTKQASMMSRICGSVIVQSVMRAATGALAVSLYYADLASDVQVTALLFMTGNYLWACMSSSLLFLQFIVVYVSVLPYLRMTFGSDGAVFRLFRFFGFPSGLLFLDILMFLEPVGLLTALPFPEWLRKFIPACAYTAIEPGVALSRRGPGLSSLAVPRNDRQGHSNHCGEYGREFSAVRPSELHLRCRHPTLGGWHRNSCATRDARVR